MAQTNRILSRIADLVLSARRIVVRGRLPFLDPGNVAERRTASSLVAALSAAGDELPDWFHEDHPGIAWTALRTNGNFAAQADLRANQAVLWRVLESEFPRIARQLGINPDGRTGGRLGVPRGKRR